MKIALIVLVSLMGCAYAQKDVTIVKSEYDNKGDGTFSWVSELSDGSKTEQSGYIKDGPDPEAPIQVIQGSYSYYSPEGELISVKYIADENGFVPEGAHLPTSPPIPAEIQKSLDIIYGTQGSASQISNQYRRPAAPAANRRLSAPRRY